MFRIQAPVLVIPPPTPGWLLASISRPLGSRPTAKSRWRRKDWRSRISSLPSAVRPLPCARAPVATASSKLRSASATRAAEKRVHRRSDAAGRGCIARSPWRDTPQPARADALTLYAEAHTPAVPSV